MNTDNNIKDRLNSDEFSLFCEQNINHELLLLEKSRRFYVCLSYVIGTIGVLLSIFLFIMSIKILNGFWWLSIGFLLICLGFFASICHSIEKKYQHKLKIFIFDKILSFVGNFKNIKLTDFEKKQEEEYIKSLTLSCNFTTCNFDDCLNGEYNGVNIEIREVQLENTKSDDDDEDFQGIYLKVPAMTSINGFLTILEDEWSQDDIVKTMNARKSYGEIVKIDDLNIDDYLTVYTNNQIDARYILSQSFIERLQQLKNKGISLSIENGYIHFFKRKENDIFEVDMAKPATDISNYKKIIEELLDVLSILNTFEYHQNL